VGLIGIGGSFGTLAPVKASKGNEKDTRNERIIKRAGALLQLLFQK
jgi:hypothetical protein